MTKKQKLHGGRAKVPVIMQMEALECGAACLTMILAYYGKWVPLSKVRVDCGVSRDGSNALNVIKAARRYGLNANGYRLEPEELRQEGAFPCILHWNMNHFVVLCGFQRGYACINDPGAGYMKVSMSEFNRSFTGICLTFEPTEEFVPGGKAPGMLPYALSRLSGLKSACAFILLTTILTAVTGILSPVLSRTYLDKLLTGTNPAWFVPFLWVTAGVYAAQLGLSALRTVTMLKINGKIMLVDSMRFMWKLLHLPLGFFSQRMSGDLLSRQSSNTSISDTIVTTLAPLLPDFASAAFYLVVMVRYSPILSLLGLGSMLVNLTTANLLSRKRVNLSRVSERDRGRLAGVTVSGIRMIETIKAAGAEEGYFQQWSGYKAGVNAADAKTSLLNLTVGLIPSMVSVLTSLLISAVGLYLTFSGNFTLGMLTAFQGFYSSFSSPALQLISAGQTLQEMRTSMERVEDVMTYPEEVRFAEQPQQEDKVYQKLSGRIEMKHVFFGYSPLAEPLIRDFNLSVEPGQRVAIVGASGSGKSTVSKLLCGLYAPFSGEILLDGKPINRIPRSVFTGSVACVDQDIILFEDTVSNNIKMWDETIEDFEVKLAARDACIHEDIIQKPGGYNYRLTEGGRNLSGGQRQRVEIARVLATDPTVLILDEATGALDAATEKKVVSAINARGITCIVIAHRLSTVRDCDKIIVLNHGVIAESGTHEELIKKGGLYTELVSGE